MVTKKSSMYSYLQGSPGKGGQYWDGTMGADDTPDREDYAHHLRSSSYQLLHSRQLSALSSGSAGSFHSRQHSNTSNYSEPDDLSPRADHASAHGHHRNDGSRYFSYDNLGPEPPSSKYHGSWNISEPDLTMGPPPYSPPGSNYQQMPAPLSPTQTSSVPPSLPSVRHSPTSSSSGRHPSSPPPPPVRDASSLKYVRYGPGHEKYPSWPMAAGAISQELPPGTASNDANVSGLPETNNLLPNQQGSTRSKSWTEQSWTEQSGEFPKDKSVVYARPQHKKQVSPYYQQQLKTVMERCERIPKEMYERNLTDDVNSPSDPYMDSYFKGAPNHYPPYDREGRPLTDKDYSIPSPPERDIGMCDLNIGQLTAAQLAEYQYQYGYADLIPGTTPLLDQLRRESDIWDGRSEHDSGQGSESLADSARYSNGRESVTTVVTNSSSASSSETLKWHGSMSDISTFSGHSRDPRTDPNVVHSSRVQPPQRHNSESILYYTNDSRGRPSRGRGDFDSRGHRERNIRSSIRDTESGLPRAINEAKNSREVERNNEMNNLKKFPSYSYTQPLSQISETPIVETHEAVKAVRSSNTRSPQSPTVDISNPPSVAERINELERNSRTGANDSVVSLRDQSESEQEPLRSSEERSNKDFNETSEQHERNDSGVYVRDRCDVSEPRGERRDSGGHKRERSIDASEMRGERRDSGGYNRENIRDTSEIRGERRDSGGYKKEHVRDASETRGERRDSGGYLRDHRDPTENRSERRDSRGSVREHRDSSENRSENRTERRDSRGSSMREQRDLMENRSDRRGSFRENRDSNENRDLSRTHLRRGSRESMRENRPDYLRFDSMQGENVRSPNSNGSARSPGHKESETSRPYNHENLQNMMNDYTEVDRRESNGSGVSYSYLDPEKKCKVSESTLKSIQKNAVMSFFYERNSAKSVSGASISDLSSASSQTSLHSADSSRSGSSHPASNSGVMPVLRSDRSVRSVKGVARLGRVPEGEAGDDEANRPVRRPSVTARDLINENTIEDSKASTSQRASEAPPALPQKNIQQTLECVRVSTNPSAVPHTTSSSEEVKEEQESANQEDGSRSQSSRGHQEPHAHTTALPTPTVVQAHATAQDSHVDTTQVQPPSHKDDAPPRPPERPPKKPTLRSLFHGPNPEGAPPPASTGGNGPIAATTVPTTSTVPPAAAHSPEKHSPDSDMRRIEESANELRNLSPQRPYYYRKPPAPDPPRSPDTAAATASVSPPAQHQPMPSVNTSPSHHSSNNHDGVHLSAPNSSLAISRSSTPDLPPPPPPPVTDEEVVLCDEPLPPPPTAAEVLPGGVMLEMPPPPLPPPPEDAAFEEHQQHQQQQYMLEQQHQHMMEQHHHQQQQHMLEQQHYQQQHQMLPPPPPRGDSSKNVVQQARQELPTYHKDSYMAHRRDWKTGFEGRYRRTISPSPPENRNLLQHRHDNNNVNNNNNINNNQNSSKGGTMPSNNGGVGGLPPAGVLRPYASTTSLLHSNNSKNVIMDNDNCINNNGWPAHSRSSSTTVNFTAEELRAFKARRAHAQQENANALENKENAPRQMHTCQSSPALRSLASDGSTTSLATSSINSGRSASPASPSRVSPSQSWRTSLDSLHRPPSSTNSNASSTPLHQREDSGMSTSTEALSLPRSSSINESLSRISQIHDSLSRSTSVADSLGRSLSLTETSSSLSEYSAPISETLSTHKSSPIQSAEPSTTTAARQEPSSPMSPVPHDGPVTARPATVTEEPLTPTQTPLSTPKSPLSPKTSLSPKPSLSLSPKSSISLSPKSSFSQKSPIPPTSPKAPTPPVSSSSISSPPNTTPSVEASNSFTATTIANISNVSTSSSALNSTSTSSTTSSYIFPVTSPCMASMENFTSGDRSNIVVLGYGRTPYQEEIDCDQFTKDIVTQLTLDNKLQALLVPGPEHKTAADYMNGVFTLELRKDLLSSQHATHPDIAASHARTTTQTTTINSSTDQANNNNNNNTAPHTNGDVCSEKSPLPSDSAYFTTSESKAKLLTRLRGSSNIMEAAQPFQDHHQLNKRKEELVKSIGRKLEILRAEQEAIKEEQKLNHELGAEVTILVVKRASNPQSDKYKLHVEEIDKITSLLLGLSGRLARAENALRTLSSETDPEEKRILESKRDKLSEQLEEAKRLKENIDRRAVQVSKVLNQYLSEDEYADYDHFIKMKAKLIMDAREIDDKIKLGDEQQIALKEMFISCQKT